MSITQQQHNLLVGLRLKREDYARLERIAKREQRPLSSLSRLFVLRCMDDYELSLQSVAPATPTTAA